MNLLFRITLKIHAGDPASSERTEHESDTLELAHPNSCIPLDNTGGHSVPREDGNCQVVRSVSEIPRLIDQQLYVQTRFTNSCNYDNTARMMASAWTAGQDTDRDLFDLDSNVMPSHDLLILSIPR